jgi:hypothetical protein
MSQPYVIVLLMVLQDDKSDYICKETVHSLRRTTDWNYPALAKHASLRIRMYSEEAAINNCHFLTAD